MGYENNRYKARIVRWVDGDTVELAVDLGQSVSVTGKYRLARIDAPEIRKKAGVTDAEKARGLALLAELNEEFPVNTEVVVSTNKKGKYGRYLVEIYLIDSGENLSDRLIKEGKAKPYQ